MTCKNCSTHLGTWTPIEYKGKTHYRHECGRVFGLHTTCHKRGKMDVSPSRKSTKREGSSSPRLLHVKYQHRGGLIPSLCKRLYHLPFIMKFYAVLFVILPAFAFAQPVNAPYQAYVDETIALLQADAPVTSPQALDLPRGEVLTPEPTIEEQIRDIAVLHGINPDKYLALIKCENKDLDPNQQSNLKYNFSDPKRGIVKGSREISFGLLQAHLPDHPDITIAQATSAEWSLNWGAKHIKEGRAWMWKTCSRVAGF